MKKTTQRLVESALMIALAVVLSELTVIKFPFGGSVTLFSQLPLVILSYRHGVKWGLFAGFTMGIFEMLFGLENFSYVYGIGAYLILVLADYLVAFTALGLGGIFRNKIKNQGAALAAGAVLVSVIRFLCHFVSGVTIWGDYAEGFKSVWLYSFTYNGGYMLPEAIITAVGAVLVSLVLDFRKPNIGAMKHKAS